MSVRIDDGVVQAAGAVVWRKALDGSEGLEVIVVHRPRYDDWTFPKGKLHAGEDHAAGAVREVAEETGFDVELGPELAHCRYVDRQSRPKYVRYYVAEATGGGFVPNDEVDRIRWVLTPELPALLSYGKDVEIGEVFADWVATSGSDR